MIVLDTNVVSEPMKTNGSPNVQAWLDRQAPETLFLTATSLSELLVGIEILPQGKRRAGLDAALVTLIDSLFETRVLAFDRAAALVCASSVSRARSTGRSLSVADAQIAAIATLHGYSVATRDIEPFVAAGVAVINPWIAAG